MPGNNLANEIYWQLEGALVWKHIALLAGADGVVSRKDDPFTGDSANRPNFNTGSTNLYLGENRQSIVPYLGANVALGSKWRVELRGSQVISATSFDQGTNLGIHLIRRSDPGTGRKYDLAFKEYDIEANVFKVSPKKGYVVIDKGVASDVQKGMKIDFFEFDYIGGNTLLASGVVLKTTADTSIVKITHLYNTKRELKEGVIARGSFK